MEIGHRGRNGANVVKLVDSDKRGESVFATIRVQATQVVGVQETRHKLIDAERDIAKVRFLC